MKTRTRIAIYTSASALWATAVIGAIGLSRWLHLDGDTTRFLVIAVACIAIVGTFIPAVQLGIARANESASRDENNRESGG